MEGKTLKEFLNKECQIFDFSLAELSMYVIIFYTNEKSIGKMISYLAEGERNLQITKEEENSYTFQNLTEIRDLILDENSYMNDDKIYELCNNFLASKVYLVKFEKKILIVFDWNLVKILMEKDEKTRILGVFFNIDEKFFELINGDGEKKLIYFKKEDVNDISQLFEDFKGKEKRNNREESLAQEEEENFDKEFEIEDEEELEERSKMKKKKAKRHKRKKSDEYEMELEAKEEKIRKRKKDEVDESKFMNDVTIFLSKLREAIELDKQSLQSKKPALEKLKLLQKIQIFLANNYCQKLFLQSSGLELLQEWIKKGKDGAYPVFNQISQMLDILSNLSVSLSNLKSCQIGGYVMDLSKNRALPHQIQKKARDIIEKWSRIVWDINTNYCDIDSGNSMYEMTFKKRRRTSDDEFDSPKRTKENLDVEKTDDNSKFSENLNVKDDDMDIYSHARIPKKGLFDFTKKPVPNVNTSRDETMKMKINYFEMKSGGRKKNE